MIHFTCSELTVLKSLEVTMRTEIVDTDGAFEAPPALLGADYYRRLYLVCVRTKELGADATDGDLQASVRAERQLEAAWPDSRPFIEALKRYSEW